MQRHLLRIELSPKVYSYQTGKGSEPYTYAIDNIRKFLEVNLPIFGICLGHQLLSLGEHQHIDEIWSGANHPVQDLKTKEVFITSQNHGFAVDEKTLPAI